MTRVTGPAQKALPPEFTEETKDMRGYERRLGEGESLTDETEKVEEGHAPVTEPSAAVTPIAPRARAGGRIR